MTSAMIELDGITKVFKSKTAVQQASFTISRGEIFGLIGQNGAGKSTLLKMIGGLMEPTSGQIHYFDRADSENQSFYERMGLLIENPGLYSQYTAFENLELMTISYGMTNRKPYIYDLLKLVGLDATNKTKVRNYSMGMKQRLGIAMAMIGSPDVLILDEPINGLDPQGIVEIRNLILDLNKKGLTIVISSHILEELSKIASKYAFIDKGEIIEVISKDELLSKCEERIELELDSASEAVPILEQKLNMTRYKVVDQHHVYIFNSHIETHQVINVLVGAGRIIHSITKQKMSLEQYFLELTGSVGEPF